MSAKKQGERLKDLRLKFGYTLSELGDKVGVSAPTIQRYESGEISTMKTPTIKKLSDIFGVSPVYIMGLDLEDKVKIMEPARKLPILGTICAGDGLWCEENYDGYFIADPEIKSADFVLNVDGNSMSGDNICNGDKAFIKSTSYVDNGKIAAILIKDTNEVMLKRIFIKEDSAILQPSNPNYSPITTNNFIVLGELVGIYHEVK